MAVITDEKLRKQFNSARKGLAGWVNLLGMVAMEAAYARGEAWLDALLPYLEANRDYVFDFINNEIKGVKMAKPEGTYLAWLDFRQLNMDVPELASWLSASARLALSPGHWFGRDGAGFARMTIAAPRGHIEDAIDRLTRAVAGN